MTKRIAFMTKWAITLLCSAYLISGCAEVQVKHVDYKDTSDGVRFCEPRPYLLVSYQPQKVNAPQQKDKEDVQSNVLSSQIVWLPNYTRCYMVKVKPGWGTVDGSVKLQNGWMLDTLGSKMDSKGPETLTAITGMVTAAGGLLKMGPGEKPQLQGLYLIDIAPDGNVKLVKQAEW